MRVLHVPLRLRRTTALLAAALLAPAAVTAQSTIWSVPSTDVQPRAELYVEADFLTHMAPFAAGGYRTYGIRSVYGLGRDVEVGLNAYRTRTDADTAAVEFQPHAKWRLLDDERRGVAVAAGAVLTLPAMGLDGATPDVMIYTVASRQFAGRFGPRLTGGAYGMLGQDAGTRAGAIVGYEQPIAGRLGLYADWCSGENRMGYAGAGVGLQVAPKVTVYAGYSVGNRGRANNGLGVYVGFSF